jgi:leucyl/phenylalanyl-tRNA--protein transferase
VPVSCYPDWAALKIAPAAADRPVGYGPVAFGADLSPASVLSAYRCGIIPLPAADEYIRNINEFRYEDQVAHGAIGLVGSTAADPYWVAWWSPDPRPVIRVSDVHLGRNARKQLRRDGALRTTANEAFKRVAQECREGREPRWLNDTLLETMIELHEQGWAHSIEVWHDDDLIGGAFGVGLGDVLSGDSMFSRQPDAARIAVADMAARFAVAGGTLIDAQWDSPFLRSLGAGLLPRDQYLPLLASSAERRALPRQPFPARRLLPPAR